VEPIVKAFLIIESIDNAAHYLSILVVAIEMVALSKK